MPKKGSWKFSSLEGGVSERKVTYFAYYEFNQKALLKFMPHSFFSKILVNISVSCALSVDICCPNVLSSFTWNYAQAPDFSSPLLKP